MSLSPTLAPSLHFLFCFCVKRSDIKWERWRWGERGNIHENIKREFLETLDPYFIRKIAWEWQEQRSRDGEESLWNIAFDWSMKHDYFIQYQPLSKSNRLDPVDTYS